MVFEWMCLCLLDIVFFEGVLFNGFIKKVKIFCISFELFGICIMCKISVLVIKVDKYSIELKRIMWVVGLYFLMFWI